MFTYQEVTDHLESNACIIMEDGDFDEGAFFQNLNNFEICYVLKENMDEISFLDILFELEVEPPEELSESYFSFVEFRKNLPVTKKTD